MNGQRRPLRWFLFILAVSILVKFFLIFRVPLTPQETYYWNYACHLALSYFDHPPLGAWTIAFFRWLIGDSAFAVRIGALGYSTGLAIGLFLLGKRFLNDRLGLTTFLSITLTPMFWLGGGVMTPDAPLLCFWVWAFYFFLQALQKKNLTSWVLFGFCTGASGLSKYTAVFIPVAVLFSITLSRNLLVIKSKGLWLSVLTAGAVFSPVLIWNAQHHWASFLFQTSRRAGELGSFSITPFLQFLGSQAGVISPLTLAAFLFAPVWALVSGWRNRRTDLLILFSWSFPIIFFFALVATRYWVKVNWVTPGYLAAALAYSFFCGGRDPGGSSKARRRWYGASVGLGFLFVLLLTVAVASPHIALGTKADSLTGWKELAGRVDSLRQEKGGAKKIFVVGYEYKVASELAFYLPDKPETYSNTVVGERGLQYDFWFDEKKLLGKDALFVYDVRNRYWTPEKLSLFFARVEPADSLPVFRAGKAVTTFYIFKCSQYLGVGGRTSG